MVCSGCCVSPVGSPPSLLAAGSHWGGMESCSTPTLLLCVGKGEAGLCLHHLLPAVPVVEVAHPACCCLLLIPEASEILKGAGEAEDVLRHPCQQRSIWEEFGHETGHIPIPPMSPLAISPLRPVCAGAWGSVDMAVAQVSSTGLAWWGRTWHMCWLLACSRVLAGSRAIHWLAPPLPPLRHVGSFETNKHPKIALRSEGCSGPSDQREAPLPCSCRKVQGSEIRRSSAPGAEKGPRG